MKNHFIILIVATAGFLVALSRATGSNMIASFVPGQAAAVNSSELIDAIQIIGFYISFVALLMGHAVLIGLPKLRPD